jgi:hypothetical protein
MSNEQYEKRMEFIVEQQAQFAIDIQQLRESQAELQAAQVRTEQVVVQTGEIVARLASVTLEGFRDVNDKIDALVDAQIKTDEKINALADSQAQTDEKINLLVDSQIKTDEKFDALADSQMRTGEDLRNLIAVVDRHLSEGRNGN